MKLSALHTMQSIQGDIQRHILWRSGPYDASHLTYIDGRGITHNVDTMTASRNNANSYETRSLCGRRWTASAKHLKKLRDVDCMACVTFAMERTQ